MRNETIRIDVDAAVPGSPDRVDHEDVDRQFQLRVAVILGMAAQQLGPTVLFAAHAEAEERAIAADGANGDRWQQSLFIAVVQDRSHKPDVPLHAVPSRSPPALRRKLHAEMRIAYRAMS